MTTYTDEGREWTSKKDLDLVNGRIDTIAVGTGSNESNTASALGSEEYRATDDSTNVTLENLTETGRVRGTIVLHGGTEVPAGATISEIAIIADGGGGGGTILFIDDFSSVTVEAGNEEEFVIEYERKR